MRRKQGKGKRTVSRELMAVALSAGALATSSATALAATDIFIKIGDIKGESTDSKFKGDIDVLSWSWGVLGANRASPKPQQPVGPAQAACASDIVIMKKIDKASPVIFAAAATGVHYPEATLTLRKVENEKEQFLEVRLKDVVISSVQQSAASGGETPTESVSLAFAGGSVALLDDSGGGNTGGVPGSCK